jgi:glucose/arabinose dehydrogenase
MIGFETRMRLRLRKDQSLRNEPTVAHENRWYFYCGAVPHGLTLGVGATVSILVVAIMAGAQIAAGPSVRTGAAAFGDWRSDAPGVRRKITVADLPSPHASRSAYNHPDIEARPADAQLRVPPDFIVEQFASALEGPRLVRVAPNGDIFVSESEAGRIRVLRAADGAVKPSRIEVFASGLRLPFGIAFWPPGPAPKYVYVGNTDSIVRFPYSEGDLHARGPAETIVNDIPGGGHLEGGGHWTRDVVFSKDGAKMFVSVGSLSNDAENLEQRKQPEVMRWNRMHGLGAAWGTEDRRADVLEYNPDGSGFRIFATGLRNCVGMAINPLTGDLWCSTNERDGLGDNLPPDYITRVRSRDFFGWPWYYIGDHEDPVHVGERPDLRDKITVPDVLLQAHSASLEMAFYDGLQFPRDYRGDAFAAEHGSWNRSSRTGYKIIRVIVHNGIPTGEYEDFMTGFVIDDSKVWGRPVGVAVAHDGSLIITEDANSILWRISYRRN